MGLTGFDSEANRRDAIRQQIVNTCLGFIHEQIKKNGATKTHEERHWLEVSIASRLLSGIRLEAQTTMFGQEIKEAEKEIDKP
jgi:hypothetical protein